MLSRTLLSAILACFVSNTRAEFFSQLSSCPLPCPATSSDNKGYTLYSSTRRLTFCNEPMLIDFNIQNPLSISNSHSTIYACTSDSGSTLRSVGNASNVTLSCDSLDTNKISGDLRINQSGTLKFVQQAALTDAVQALSQYIEADVSCNETIAISYKSGISIGVFAGAMIQRQVVAPKLLEQFAQSLVAYGMAESESLEFCNSDNAASAFTLGIVFSHDSSLATVQRAVATWSAGNCIGTGGLGATWKSIEMPIWGLASAPTAHRSRSISSRGSCTTTTVQSGDSCAVLAKRCHITGAQFMKYNPSKSLCSTLRPGQHVCCSPGTLPDFAPKPQSDGTCAVHKVASGDTCSGIASSNSISVSNIESWNKKTWQFMGCDNLQIGQVICLSAGSPPMPSAVINAICGPQVPGTKKPANISDDGALASLNPCPLNACCDIWGQCGTDREFCTVSKSSTGAPGTAAPGQNGCISHCGTDIIKSAAPSKPFNIGYYESFNLDRMCLQMEPSQIDISKYTHLHFAFANISEDFHVQIAGSTARVWDDFIDIQGPKRIISFGGWSFSTDTDTFPIFRKVVSATNRQTFIQSLVQFVSNSGVDGVDFDWEYPGAPDIPGIPPGDKDDGSRYLQFLTELRLALPAEKSISIAAPASYWYLKGFPIAEISKVVNYIIYMTYDLHGQWDYGNKFSDPGCPQGSCLRSQVNLTETNTALSMITKAGVPSNKIAVGVTSYGRSFKMTDPNCQGPMCTFVGPKSAATPGRCTVTAGYIANAEIYDILGLNKAATTRYDNNSNSDVMIYDSNWVSYMTETTKASRRSYYLGMNFLGTTDWAIDLARYATDTGDGGTGDDDNSVTFAACTDVSKYHTIDDVINDHSIPDNCFNAYMLTIMADTMNTALRNYTDIMNDGYTGKYNAFVKQVRAVAPIKYDDFYHTDMNNYYTCLYAVPSDGGKTYTNHSGGCPPDNVPNEYEGQAYNIYFEVKNQTILCNDIEDKYGIDCSWLEIQSQRDAPCVTSDGCPDWGNVFRPEIRSDFDVPDPGQVITKSLANYTGLAGWISGSAAAAAASMFWGDTVDAIDGASTAVFTTQSAVTSMQKVADIGEKAEEEERKAIILAFLSAFLLLLPGLGEALSSVIDVAAVARIATLVGEVGSGALTIYDIVEDPQSAPMAICGLLLGGAVLGRDETLWSKAGAIRRGMTDDVIGSLGDDVAVNMNKVANARRGCSP